MRIGVLGDIHGNLEALTAVVEHMGAHEEIDHWVQVGDIVGYGADPGPCIDIVRELGCVVSIGNHDAAVVGRLDPDYFNPYARMAIDWTRDQLGETHRTYLANLPLLCEHHEYTVVHGSLHMPDQFGYVISTVEAADSIQHQKTRIAFVGHSHVPAAYMQRDGSRLEDLEFIFGPEIHGDIRDYVRVLVNVGSVGQPRDEDPRAAYCVYDTSTLQLKIARVAYDIESAQTKIRQAGLPSVLADRLALGV
ncbi:MAG: metallophosphoesterase family protein [Planctomycetes bacterium]|nr:metallophosphoesterase family protein [Planctomycetota bacterium]